MISKSHGGNKWNRWSVTMRRTRQIPTNWHPRKKAFRPWNLIVSSICITSTTTNKKLAFNSVHNLRNSTLHYIIFIASKKNRQHRSLNFSIRNLSRWNHLYQRTDVFHSLLIWPRWVLTAILRGITDLDANFCGLGDLYQGIPEVAMATVPQSLCNMRWLNLLQRLSI